MNLTNAENYNKKILQCVQEIADGDKTLYGKSKVRLEGISETSQQVIGVIDGILGTDNTRSEAQITVSTQNADLHKKVDSLSDEVERIKTLLQADTTSKPKTSEPKQKIVADNAGSHATVDKKYIKTLYGRILKSLANTECNVHMANQCAVMLWRWYDGRIFNKYEHTKTFFYNIEHFKEIIYAFVFLFGYHVEKGTLDRFLQKFDEWLEALGVDPDSCRWFAPYEVYQLSKQMDKKYANLTAVVIWDILLDNGLQELCNTEPHSMYPEDNAIYERIEKAKCDLLDPYVNYKDDPAILKSLNLL